MPSLRSLITIAATFTFFTHSISAQAQTDTPRTGPNPHLFTSGLVTTGLSYTPALLVAMTSPRSEDKYLYAPFAGPWLDLAHRPREGDTNLNRGLLVVDGVVQAIGALELVASFMFVNGSSSASIETKHFTAHVSPTRLRGGAYGLTAVGTF